MTPQYLDDTLAAIERARVRHPGMDLSALDDRLPLRPAHFVRSSLPWHLTASTFVCDPGCASALLVRHPVLDQLLPPGGHLEGGECLLAGALRELGEECGYGLASLLSVDPVPFDVDFHAIPASAKKREPEHFHLDFAFLVTVNRASEMRAAAELPVEWVALADPRIAAQPRLRRMAAKARQRGG